MLSESKVRHASTLTSVYEGLWVDGSLFKATENRFWYYQRLKIDFGKKYLDIY